MITSGTMAGSVATADIDAGRLPSARMRGRDLQLRPLVGATLWDDLMQLVRNDLQRRRNRRLLRRLVRRDWRLLVDMGLDPWEVRAVVEGTVWDAWRPELAWRGPPV